MQYSIRVLSPLHIGCGETYNGLSYVIDNGRLYFIPPDRLVDSLGDKVDDFVAWIDGNARKIDDLERKKGELRNNDPRIEKVKKELRFLRNNFNMRRFLDHQDIRNRRINLEEISRYSMRLAGNFYNSNDVNSFIKQMGQVYIPGTEVKGAIRTAIAYCALIDDSSIYSDLEDQIRKFAGQYGFLIQNVKNQQDLRMPLNQVVQQPIPPEFEKYKNWKLSKIKDNVLCNEMEKITQDLEARVFNAKSHSGSADAKYDVLKFLHVGDSETRLPIDVLSIAEVSPFNIKRAFRMFNEIIIPGSEFILTDLGVEGDKSRKTKMDKIGFNESHTRLVDSLDVILNCCYRFSKDLLEEEIDYFQGHNKSNIVTHLKELASLNHADPPVLRIGKDEGFLSVTVALAVKKKDPSLYKDTLIHAIKGKSYETDLMPKTRKIVIYNGEEYTSGWIQIRKSQEVGQSVQSEPNRDSKNNAANPTKADLSPLFEKYGKG